MGFEKGVGGRVNVNSDVICSNEKKCRLEIYKRLLIGSKGLIRVGKHISPWCKFSWLCDFFHRT